RSDAGLVVVAVEHAWLLMRSDHRVEHLGDGTLLGLGERLNLLQLLLQLRRRPALAGGAPGGRADQFFDGGKGVRFTYRGYQYQGQVRLRDWLRDAGDVSARQPRTTWA